MPCPFGFTAEDADDDGEIDEEPSGPESDAKEEPAPPKSHAPKSKKKAGGKDDLKFDFDKDPVSWFYQNQIKSEKEFAEKKDMLRAEARKRLDAIMAKKNKQLEWPSDSEFDLSIRSSELSDLDSDVDSLGSLVSCANSWIEDARYSTPAENILSFAAYSALVAMCYCLWVTLQAVNSARKWVGVLNNSIWPSAAALAAALLGGAFIGVLMAIRYRAKRMLLISQSAMLVLYSAFLVIVCGVIFQPTVVDPKLRETACVRYGKSDQGSRLCKMLPDIESELAEKMELVRWSSGVAAAGALVVLVCSVWYLYELSYIEKKAIKHKRRHKRRKHSIPWDKIKVVGPIMTCGSGQKAGAAPGGKCPIAHGGGTAAAAPKAAAAAAKPAVAKKKD